MEVHLRCDTTFSRISDHVKTNYELSPGQKRNLDRISLNVYEWSSWDVFDLEMFLSYIFIKRFNVKKMEIRTRNAEGEQVDSQIHLSAIRRIRHAAVDLEELFLFGNIDIARDLYRDWLVEKLCCIQKERIIKRLTIYVNDAERHATIAGNYYDPDIIRFVSHSPFHNLDYWLDYEQVEF